MDEINVSKKKFNILYLIVGFIIFAIILIIIFTVFKKQDIISPLPSDTNKVRIIFVSPIPSQTPQATVVASSSASPVSSKKPVSTSSPK